MDWAIQLITTLDTTIENYAPLASFIAPFIAADLGILLMGFFSAKNTYNLIIPLIFCSLGLIVLDSFWFAVVKSKLFKYIKKKFFTKKILETEKHIEKISHKKDYLILFLVKFLIGSRALILVYLVSKQKLKFKQFLKYNSIASILWVLILTFTGWLAGQGFYKITNAYRGIKYAATTITIIIAIILLIKFLIKKKITN